mmetsp:Transcript_4494/g.6944  ORF Transcript_4494/g.6944 Transcript_4494/m.6944 type:complete len:347 (+) Transcript_4494:124-1164(+)|eukprot:CAMPEP_0178924860 /NCGR_PEP_ID=MMETSP0786-20121207/17564_1 /TAXON_ID=186022 /ORGANISM="Thalassionema frauenfeldii, Strain CCMP 1798" /LENGTH=346 /DNA_ID=CAMNT_0020599623 /DNA_START=65 /DNA_END=1105 /DNA_ORIENTATION=-
MDSLSSSSIVSSLPDNTPLVGSLWMASSAIFTTYATNRFLKYEPKNKEISEGAGQASALNSNQLPRSLLLTLLRFFASSLIGFVAHPNFNVLQRIQETKAVIPTFAMPALFLFLANFTNAISLSKVGISLTSTSKCGIPLITVLLTLISDGREALPSALTITTLIPIAVGIGAAAWNSPTFDTFGFLAAMVSCTAQSLLNVTSKKAISKTGVSGAQAQRAMVTVSFAMTAIYSLVSSKFVIPKRKEDLPSSGNQQQAKGLGFLRIEVPALLTSLAVAAYHLEYNLSFMFVKLVAPITYGTCDAIRRLSTIVAGHIMFGETKFSRLNIFGIGLAMLGALAYSFASNS